MDQNSIHEKGFGVYPGEYHLLPETETLLNEVKYSRDEEEFQQIITQEFEDCFKIEVSIPKVKRENILIHVQDKSLFILIPCKNCETITNWNLHINELGVEYYQQHIGLPDNADTEFASAEYRGDILFLHMAKTQEQIKTVISQIIVY
jgi:HSP20 family protein